MQEKRIIAIIGLYGSAILSTVSTQIILCFLNLALAIFWLCRYIYLINRKFK